MRVLFRNLVVAVMAIYIAFLIIPFYWEQLYDQDTLTALSWNNWGSYVPIPIIDAIAWFFPVAYAIISVGLFFFKNWARKLFLIFTLSVGFLYPLCGLAVITGWESVISYYMILGDGIILTMAYFTSVRNEFNT